MSHHELPAVLVVSDDPVARARARAAIADRARYIFECGLDDVPSMMRSVYVHTVIVLGDDKPLQLARLREVLAGSQVPARRLILATSPDTVPGALAAICD